MVDRADLSHMTQDERLRALERELVRSGSSLYEWAAAIVDERKPSARFSVPARGGFGYGSHISDLTTVDGLRWQFFNQEAEDKVVEVWISPRVQPSPHVAQAATPNARLRRGVCSVCGREVAASFTRHLASRHVGLTPGSNGINGLCEGSSRAVRAVFCIAHGSTPCARCIWIGLPTEKVRELLGDCERGVHEACRGEAGNRSDRDFCECSCHGDVRIRRCSNCGTRLADGRMDDHPVEDEILCDTCNYGEPLDE